MPSVNWLSALANHLWQSTAFGAAAWLLALALRKNRAGTRYWIWLCASLKFLFPLSLLFALGQSLRPAGLNTISHPGMSVAIAQAAQPFAEGAIAVAIPAPVVTAHPANVLPVALLLIWLCGVVGVAFGWWLRWRRVRNAVRAASATGYAATVPILASPAQIEPGIFGIFRPVLLMPQGIARRLTPAQMDAILAHEMCHVRRRDNLTGAIHMLVAAAFWFHPMVWWIGARLVEERERACDEEVLRLGGRRETYAESILSVCKHYVESPVPCVSGIGGSDLKQRIVRIMTDRFSQNLSLGRKILLGAAALLAVAGPLTLGALAVTSPAAAASSASTPPQGANGAPWPSFEVASIKLDTSGVPQRLFQFPSVGRFHTINMPAKDIIQFAYNIKPAQLDGAPPWTSSQAWVIDAKVDDAMMPDFQKLSRQQQIDQVRLMLRSLLADRFKLVLDHQTKDAPIYALVVSKGGPKLTPTAYKGTPGEPPPPGTPRESSPHLLIGGDGISAVNQPMSGLANILAAVPDLGGRTVVDQTGITGNYDFELKFTVNIGPKGAPTGDDAAATTDSGLSVFTALQDQLGLRLESTRGPVDMYTVEHIEQPAEN
jgi:uncharacterized protein (TIGR03435 family)